MEGIARKLTPCILHPNIPNKGGHVVLHRQVDGVRTNPLAHRLALCEATGKPYDYYLYALHKCDVNNCVNLEHLYWGTLTQNQIDRAQRGPRGIHLKLNPDSVRAIRASTDTGIALAKRFGVSEGTISFVRNRKIWDHIK